MKEYSHVVVDKQNVGLDTLRNKIRENGLLTAQASNYQLSQGSINLEHHLHVFLWDETVTGEKGRLGIILALGGENCFTVRVRWPVLTESGSVFAGTLKGDSGHNGPPSGKSTNGAWAYKGNIPAKYCFIEGLHTKSTPNYAGWYAGEGW